ncbi:MAG: ATP-binding protein [Alphaproteobacteria bacterium]|nr:ATP-binding protein [Alphaproteobacteria bacterium]
MDDILGRVLAVSGSQMSAEVTADRFAEASIRIGSMIKVRSADLDVVGAISAAELDSTARIHLNVDLLGEISPSEEGLAQFHRGVSCYPIPGSPVRAATSADLTTVYTRPATSNVSVGSLYHDVGRPAFVLIDELLAKNFAVLGATGSGKSCAVTLMLSAVLADHPNAHIIVLDPHNEYANAFGERAELFNVDNLLLPLWLLDFEEAVGVLVRGGTVQDQETQAIILKDAIIRARRRHWSDATTSITVDAPLPFAAADLLRFIDEAMGKLDNPNTSAPYLRLRTRLESLRTDRRYAFLFSDSVAIRDTLSRIVGRLLRIPVDGKPLTIIDLSGVPSEITDVVVSLVCRLTFNFALWSDRQRLPPILLVCEEAHRYVPASEPIGFGATSRAITRIAREGRKYGVSLALISQTPSELSGQVLSQCGTVFAMRLGHYLDQTLTSTAWPDAARGMLEALPTLRTQEAIAFGEGVPLPVRIRFDDLPPERRPRSESAKFSRSWQNDSGNDELLDEGIRCWREQRRKLIVR